MNEIRSIVLHCSDSSWGDAEEIDRWHEARWGAWTRDEKVSLRHIGYHAVILNGYRRGSKLYDVRDDGVIEYGRPLDVAGVHVGNAGRNADTLGVCMIGVRLFSLRQLHATAELIAGWCVSSGLSADDVVGHCELDSAKTCPNVDMRIFRGTVERFLLASASQ